MTSARLNQLRADRTALLHQLEKSSKKQRRARTRTLIQLGGLLHKCGLIEKFGIELGEDLQVDETAREKAKRLEEWLENNLHFK